MPKIQAWKLFPFLMQIDENEKIVILRGNAPKWKGLLACPLVIRFNFFLVNINIHIYKLIKNSKGPKKYKIK